MKILVSALVSCIAMCGPLHAESNTGGHQEAEISTDIKAIFQKPVYEKSIWGLRVVDLDFNHSSSGVSSISSPYSSTMIWWISPSTPRPQERPLPFLGALCPRR